MRALTWVFLWFATWSAVSAAEPTAAQDTYAALLARYARPEGVRYSAWSKNPDDVNLLRGLTRQIAEQGPAGMDRAVRMAYLINAYNIWTLHGVLQNNPPISVRDIAPDFGFFSKATIKVAGESMSLNTLEKERLLKVYQDPRIHFAVNCASRSCPPLRPEPYTAARLEAQLDDATRRFLRSPGNVRRSTDGKSAAVSEIFFWYAGDFAPAGGALAFINRHLDRPLPPTTTLTPQPYDWSLNEAP